MTRLTKLTISLRLRNTKGNRAQGEAGEHTNHRCCAENMEVRITTSLVPSWQKRIASTNLGHNPPDKSPPFRYTCAMLKDIQRLAILRACPALKTFL
ncbi:MAG: hypothetical protein A4E53_00988 [Pelotomaculum sp. PtaB.Bin104]|nr:MAG: hypothetical protein A4E53_00988 [Pelotomaculum sp. PtaB.Bin104]